MKRVERKTLFERRGSKEDVGVQRDAHLALDGHILGQIFAQRLVPLLVGHSEREGGIDVLVAELSPENENVLSYILSYI